MTQHRFRLRVHAALPSTSDLVAQLAASGEPDGLAVLAHRQTAGRGTQGRAWESRAGNLHLSVLLRPAEPLRHAPQWGLLAAVALGDAVAATIPDPRAITLKWPNDLMLNGAKAAGILAEASPDDQGGIAWLCLGIGVNLDHAPQVEGRVTACLADTGIVAPRPEAFAETLLAALDGRRTQRITEGFAPIRAAWLERGPALDTHLALSSGIAGRFAGLAEDGRLLLATGGRVHALASGELT
ncbi:biotin--[acetyl-CoA-carboxylase] ligase [Roseomonas fluvialis]|uniref:Biotin--[acetyl-CoA-carboxylase] ligase n=1 Tax=Roseomonas fluvialis TaxID=1750527 RepID=A0ABN6P1N2_9PROT|nr:biotin--[acetyl-CoA-carboxylase] ligase [Roseomonas fluvialis]BDG72572.1 biotin--[acetyl-CoA-carboxylase] ligase [Roseomonas fluvialis]